MLTAALVPHLDEAMLLRKMNRSHKRCESNKNVRESKLSLLRTEVHDPRYPGRAAEAHLQGHPGFKVALQNGSGAGRSAFSQLMITCNQ